MDAELLSVLKTECEKALAENTRFHDYGHALEVLENTKEILKTETGDEEVLFAAALFHDVSNQNGPLEGEDGANITKKVLKNIPEFPQNKIIDVCRLIKSISGKAVNIDEIIINEADRMAVFSKLSIVRGFMIYAQKGFQPKEAAEDFLNYVERKYANFKLESVKKLVENDYQYTKNFLNEILKFYE
jgi:HD superfamily phosphodiesterase